jgi:hypothetical protein
VSPLDTTNVLAPSPSPSFQVQPSVPAVDGQSTSTPTSDDGWGIEITNTSSLTVSGLSAQVAVQAGGPTVNFDFTDSTCSSTPTNNEADCTVGTGSLAPGAHAIVNVYVETSDLDQGTSISGSVNVTSTNAGTQSSSLADINVIVITNGTETVAVPEVVVKSYTGPLSPSVPARVKLKLPGKKKKNGPLESVRSPDGPTTVGPAVSVTLEPLSGSQDPEMCPTSSGGCEGDIIEIEGSFSAYKNAANPISAVVEIFYGSTPPAGKIYFQTAADKTPVKLPACVLKSGAYNTPCVDGPETISGTSGNEYTTDTILFIGGDPLVGRR